ncbi:hypothetical protein ACFX2I_003330 [Malus domestica]
MDKISGLVFVSELGIVDRVIFSASLAHEPGDSRVEGRSFVVYGLAGAADAFLSSAESPKVLGGAGGGVGGKLHHDAADQLAFDERIGEDSAKTQKAKAPKPEREKIVITVPVVKRE